MMFKSHDTFKMAELHDEDYAWDHAGESLTEDSPLLGDNSSEGSNFLTSYNRQDHITISRRQAEYLLHTLQDNTTLVHTLLIANDERHDPFSSHAGASCQGCRTVLKLLQDGVLLVTIVLQVLNIILLSILESTGGHGDSGRDAGFAIVVTSQTVNFIIFTISLPRLIWMIWHRSYSRVYLLEVYVTCTLVFAGMYLMTFSLDSSSWLFGGGAPVSVPTAPRDASSLEAVASELKIVTYVKMFHTSLCTASMFGNPAFIAVKWYNHLLQIAQLILSLTLVLCLVSQAITYSATHRHALMRNHARRRRGSHDSIASRGSGNYGALDSNPPSRA